MGSLLKVPMHRPKPAVTSHVTLPVPCASVITPSFKMPSEPAFLSPDLTFIKHCSVWMFLKCQHVHVANNKTPVHPAFSLSLLPLRASHTARVSGCRGSKNEEKENCASSPSKDGRGHLATHLWEMFIPHLTVSTEEGVIQSNTLVLPPAHASHLPKAGEGLTDWQVSVFALGQALS